MLHYPSRHVAEAGSGSNSYMDCEKGELYEIGSPIERSSKRRRNWKTAIDVVDIRATSTAKHESKTSQPPMNTPAKHPGKNSNYLKIMELWKHCSLLETFFSNINTAKIKKPLLIKRQINSLQLFAQLGEWSKNLSVPYHSPDKNHQVLRHLNKIDSVCSKKNKLRSGMRVIR